MNLFLTVLLAAMLPGFKDFRLVDRARRESGELQTPELARLTRVETALIVETASRHPGDLLVQWGAAELLTDWEKQRAQFESILKSDPAPNVAVALRFACFAVQNRDPEPAWRWLRYVQERDPTNLAPWLAELRLRQQAQAEGKAVPQLRLPPPTATQYRDDAPMAGRARIALLEAAGYSKYAARRIGCMPDAPLLTIARTLATPPIEPATLPMLQAAARSMQLGATFLLTEMIGQALERAALSAGSAFDVGTTARLDKLADRRIELIGLVGMMERDVVDQAGETELIAYYDEVLTYGEESAMERLSSAVKRAPSR